MKYDVILFDADDTLLDFKKAEREALAHTLVKNGLPSHEGIISAYSEINDSLWKKLERGETTKEELKTKRFEELIEKFGFDADPIRMSADYISSLATMAYMLDGAEELCRDLKDKYRMYIVTNGMEDVQRGRLNSFAVKDCFLDFFISGKIGYEKPRREFFEIATSGIENFDKKKALIIGDSLSSDMRGGIDFGIDTCWYNPFGKEKPEGMDITYIASSFDDIKELL